MDLEDFEQFLNAVKEENQDLINSVLSKNDISQEHFTGKLESLFCIVAELGTLETAARMCELGLNINSQDTFGRTPIMHAIKHSKEMVKLLLSHGASADIKSNYGITPLHGALFTGSEEIVKEVLNEIFRNEQNGDTVYPTRVQNIQEIVKALLDYKWELGFGENDYPLLILFAASIGNMELFSLTLDDCRKNLDYIKGKKRKQRHQLILHQNEARHPEELNVQGIYDRTALHYAVKKQLPDVVLFLLKAGADANCKTDQDLTPLDYAANLGNVEICKILLNFGAEVNPSSCGPLYFASGCNIHLRLSYSCDEYYYENLCHLPNITKKDCEVDPALILSTMRLLLQNKANPDSSDYYGCTPLMNACSRGLLDVVKLLLEFNANISACDIGGYTVLHYAALSPNFEIVDFLLEKGFDIDAYNNNNSFTPLMFAAFYGGSEKNKMVEYLADLGTNINAGGKDDNTPFLLACYQNLDEIIEILLALGVEYKVRFKTTKIHSIPRHFIGSYNPNLNCVQQLIISFHAMKDEILDSSVVRYVRNLSKCVIDDYRINEMDMVVNMINDHFTRCKVELTKLKSTKIVKNRRYSFNDFLTSNIYFAVKIIKNKEARMAFADNKYSSDFPCYRYLLEKRFERIVILEENVDKMVDFFGNIGKIFPFHLPIPIIDKILSFFNATDFRNFGRFLSKNNVNFLSECLY